MKVVLTGNALADLASIASFIASDNPERAGSFLLEMREACSGLSHNPERFPLVARYQHLQIRKRVFGRYLILYRIGATEIEIIHIAHEARDWDALL